MKTALSLLIVSIAFSCVNTPDPKVWRQDDIYCWYKSPYSKKWETKGYNYDCPDNTQYLSPPALDQVGE